MLEYNYLPDYDAATSQEDTIAETIGEIDVLTNDLTLWETETERLQLARLLYGKVGYLLQLLQTLSLLLCITERLRITNLVPFI